MLNQIQNRIKDSTDASALRLDAEVSFHVDGEVVNRRSSRLVPFDAHR